MADERSSIKYNLSHFKLKPWSLLEVSLRFEKKASIKGAKALPITTRFSYSYIARVRIPWKLDFLRKNLDRWDGIRHQRSSCWSMISNFFHVLWRVRSTAILLPAEVVKRQPSDPGAAASMFYKWSELTKKSPPIDEKYEIRNCSW